MWPKSSSVKAVYLVKKICYINQDNEFFLRDCFLLVHPVGVSDCGGHVRGKSGAVLVAFRRSADAVRYWKIIAALRRTSSRVSSVRRPPVGVNQRPQPPAGPSTSDTAAVSRQHSNPLSKKQKNVIATMLVVTSSFIVCWLPYQFMLVAVLCGQRSFWSPTLYNGLLIVAFVNLAANPFIYATGLYQFVRVKSVGLLYRLSRRETQVHANVPQR